MKRKKTGTPDEKKLRRRRSLPLQLPSAMSFNRQASKIEIAEF